MCGRFFQSLTARAGKLLAALMRELPSTPSAEESARMPPVYMSPVEMVVTLYPNVANLMKSLCSGFCMLAGKFLGIRNGIVKQLRREGRSELSPIGTHIPYVVP